MGPLALGLLVGANVGMGALKANQAAKQRQQEANIRAAEIEASPWTGRAPSTQVSTQSLNPWAEMAGGGINAIGQAAALEKAGLFTDQTPTMGGANAAEYFKQETPDFTAFQRPFSQSNPWSLMAQSK